MAATNIVDDLLVLFDAAEDDEKHADVLPDEITAELVYSGNVGKRFHIEMPSDANPTGKFIMSARRIDHKIRNARNAGCMFGSHGFQLINQKTALATADFYQNPDGVIQKTYYAEMQRTVKALTGAQHVIVVHHVLRRGGEMKDTAKEQVDAPAHAVHCDYTNFSGMQSYKHVFPKLPKDGTDWTQGRFALINCWRNISDTNVICDDHLAVCDGRSVVAPDDYLKYDYIAPTGHKSESFYLNAAGQARHKWYYYPRMRKNELLVFMQYDSDVESASRYTFHTAIHDPTAKKGDPARESIEVRLVAFFPKHRPNTIPEDASKPRDVKEVVPAAVQGIIGALKMPQAWPSSAKKALSEKLKECDFEEVLTWLVKGSRDGGFHGLDGASEETVKKVVEALMEKEGDVKEIAVRNFASDGDQKENR